MLLKINEMLAVTDQRLLENRSKETVEFTEH